MNGLSDEQVERLTDRLVRLGYNAVRIHHHDDLWAKDADGARAKLDRLVAVCIRKGIYLMTDLYVSCKVSWRELGIDRDGIADGDSAKLRMMVTEAGFACWKRYAADFLLHVTPEMGRSLRDEPAMPFLVMINESSPHSHWDAARGIEEFHNLWKIWLAEVRAEDLGCFPQLTDDGFLARGLWWNPNAESNATSSFWTWVPARFPRLGTAFANVLSPSDMRPSARDHLAVVPPWAASAPSLSWRVRLGVSFDELPGDVIGFGRESRGPSVADMPDSGVLSDTEQGNHSVSTPRFVGVFADVGERQDASPFRVSIGGSRACVAAASLSDDDLARAPRILVWHLTDLHGAGFAYAPFEHLSGVISWGTGRSLLARVGSAAVALRLDDAASYDVWTLDSVGNRCARVATEIREGYLCFVTVIRPNADARFYHEVVRREACAIPGEDSPR